MSLANLKVLEFRTQQPHPEKIGYSVSKRVRGTQHRWNHSRRKCFSAALSGLRLQPRTTNAESTESVAAASHAQSCPANSDCHVPMIVFCDSHQSWVAVPAFGRSVQTASKSNARLPLLPTWKVAAATLELPDSIAVTGLHHESAFSTLDRKAPNRS